MFKGKQWIVGLRFACITTISFVLAFASYHSALSQSNSKPTIDPIPDPAAIDEDAISQTVNISGIGDSDGGTQIITVTAVSSNQALIPDANITVNYTNPGATGSIDYISNTDAFGTATITVTVMDDGGTAMGGIDTTTEDFLVVVNPVNDKPSFTKGPDQPIAPALLYEDAGGQTFSNWATNINRGGTLGNENFQTVTFDTVVVEMQGNLAFDNFSVTSTGTLLFTPTENTNGLAKIELTLVDNGSGTLPNENVSAADTIIITVTDVNDVPTFSMSGDVTVLENAGAQTFNAWASGMNPGGGSDEAGQNLTFVLTETGSSGPLTFVDDPAIDPVSGNLTFEAAVGSNGSITYDVTLVDDGSSTSPNANTSGIQTFTLTVDPINDEPDFTVPDTIETFEDFGDFSMANFATSITAGAPDEDVSQILTFTLSVASVTGTLSFDENPRINSSGTLFFVTADGTNGTAEVEATLTDDGPGSAPDDNTSETKTFTVIVTAVNDPPSFVKSFEPEVDEDEGPVTFSGWAQNISPGPSDEQNQTVAFQLTELFLEGNLSFLIPPSVNANGDLSFETDLHTNGRVSYEIRLMDDGPSDELNNNISPAQGFTIEINAVNDAPEFLVGQDLTSNENAGLVTFEGWATGIGPGGGSDEMDQGFNFSAAPVSISGNLVFSIGPLVSETGDISYQTAPNTFGEGEFELILTDDGSSDAPNVATSDPQTFKIIVSEINDPPTDIVISSTSVIEGQPPGIFVGTFSATDPDDQTHTFLLATGEGDEDNDAFTIEGDNLLSAITFDFREKNSYSIRVSATDSQNLIEKAFIIDVLREEINTVGFPNAFTPNGDGENDRWLIEDIEYFPTAAVTVYNRNGNRVFSSIGYEKPWDGTWNGNQLPIGTYYVVINLRNQTPEIQGTVTILR